MLSTCFIQEVIKCVLEKISILKNILNYLDGILILLQYFSPISIDSDIAVHFRYWYSLLFFSIGNNTLSTIHLVGTKMARYGCKMAIYQLLFLRGFHAASGYIWAHNFSTKQVKNEHTYGKKWPEIVVQWSFIKKCSFPISVWSKECGLLERSNSSSFSILISNSPTGIFRDLVSTDEYSISGLSS